LFDTSSEFIEELHNNGKRVICYFSAGSYENWREDTNKFPERILGNSLDDWEDEKWLDISNLSLLIPIMESRLDMAVDKECDAVEPDNMDGYMNDSGFGLTFKEQLDYNILISELAHKRGLSVGLKNDLDQIIKLEPYFDFSVNEQCHRYNECDKLIPFIENGKPVFNAEYDERYVKNINNERENMCNESIKSKFQTLILPLDLDDEFRISCNSNNY